MDQVRRKERSYCRCHRVNNLARDARTNLLQSGVTAIYQWSRPDYVSRPGRSDLRVGSG